MGGACCGVSAYHGRHAATQLAMADGPPPPPPCRTAPSAGFYAPFWQRFIIRTSYVLFVTLCAIVMVSFAECIMESSGHLPALDPAAMGRAWA